MANLARKILVADDDHDIRTIVTSLLRDLRYEVLEAEDGRRAIEIVRDSLPDLAILDISMPHVVGHEVCSYIKSQASEEIVPVIMLTASTTVEEKVKAFEAGADDFLSKPFSIEELRSRVLAWMRVRELTIRLGEKNRELERLQERLVSQERQHVVHQIAGTAAHQLGQPVSAILLNCYLLEMMPKEDGRFGIALEAVKNDAKRLASMIEQLRGADAARVEEYSGDRKIIAMDE